MLGLPDLTDLVSLGRISQTPDLRLSSSIGARAKLDARLVGAAADVSAAASTRTGAEVLLTNAGTPPPGWDGRGAVEALRATRPERLAVLTGGGPPCGRFGTSIESDPALRPGQGLNDATSAFARAQPGEEFSAAVWVAFATPPPSSGESVAQFPPVMATAVSGTRGWVIRRADGRARFEYRDEASNPAVTVQVGGAAGALVPGRWSLVGFNWLSSGAECWCDGVRVASAASAALAAGFAAGLDSLAFETGTFRAGFVSAVAFWRRPLSAAEWAALFAAGADSTAGGLCALDYRSWSALSRPAVRFELDDGGAAPALGTHERPCGAARRSVTPFLEVDGILERTAAASLSLSMFVKVDRLDTLNRTLDLRLPASDAEAPVGSSPVVRRARDRRWGTVGGQPELVLPSGWTLGGETMHSVRGYTGGLTLQWAADLPPAADYAHLELLVLRPTTAGDGVASSTIRLRLATAARTLRALVWAMDTVSVRADIAASLTGWSAILVDRSYAAYDADNATWKPRARETDILIHGEPGVEAHQQLVFDLGGGPDSGHVISLGLGSPQVSLSSPARVQWSGNATRATGFYISTGHGSFDGSQLTDDTDSPSYLTSGASVPINSFYAWGEGRTGRMGVETDAALPAADAAALGMVVAAGGRVFAAVLARVMPETGDPRYEGALSLGDYGRLRAILLRDDRITVRLVRTDFAGVDTTTWDWTEGGQRPSFRWRIQAAASTTDFVDLHCPAHDDGAWHHVGLSVAPGRIRAYLDGAEGASSDAAAPSGLVLTTQAWRSGEAAGLGSRNDSGVFVADELTQWGRALRPSEFRDAAALRSVERLFGGYLDGPARSWPRAGYRTEVAVSAVSYARDLDDRTTPAGWQVGANRPLADALRDLLGAPGVGSGSIAVSDGGAAFDVPALPAPVVDSAFGAATVGPASFDSARASEVLDWFRDQVRGVWHVDPYGVLTMRPASGVRASAEIVSAADARSGVSVESDESRLRTVQTVFGADTLPAPVTLASPTIRTYRRVVSAVERDDALTSAAAVRERCRSLLAANDTVSLRMVLPLVPGRYDFLRAGDGLRTDASGTDPRIVWLVESVSLVAVVDSGGLTVLRADLRCLADDTPWDAAATRPDYFRGHVPRSTPEVLRRLHREA